MLEQNGDKERGILEPQFNRSSLGEKDECSSLPPLPPVLKAFISIGGCLKIAIHPHILPSLWPPRAFFLCINHLPITLSLPYFVTSPFKLPSIPNPILRHPPASSPHSPRRTASLVLLPPPETLPMLKPQRVETNLFRPGGRLDQMGYLITSLGSAVSAILPIFEGF